MAGLDEAATLRTIDYRGAPLHLSGPPEDRYFQSVDLAEAANAPLHYVAAHAIGPQSPVMDIGANIGVTASVFARHTAGPVHAVEPSPVIFPHLQATCRANGADGVRAHNLALGREPGTLRFFADATAGAASHLITDATLARASDIEVTVKTLDMLVREEEIDRLDLVKIDVEGYEIDVLEGGVETFRTLRPNLLVEFNAFTMVAFRDINPRMLLTRLGEIFPYCYRFFPAGPVLIETEQQVIDFLHHVMVVHGSVDDLYCTFEPIAGR